MEVAPALREGLVSFRENQRGVSYESLFGAYLEGAKSVEVIDPYIRSFHQCRNLIELETCIRHMDLDCSVRKVHLLTAPDDRDAAKQASYLQQIRDAVEPMGIEFSWDMDESEIHVRGISA